VTFPAVITYKCLFILSRNRKLADLTNTSGSGGYITRIADNGTVNVDHAGEVGLTVASRRTRCNKPTKFSELEADEVITSA